MRVGIPGDERVLQAATPWIAREPRSHSHYVCESLAVEGLENLCLIGRCRAQGRPRRMELFERRNGRLIRRERQHVITDIFEVPLDLPPARFADGYEPLLRSRT